jgi:hypothetical protein
MVRCRIGSHRSRSYLRPLLLPLTVTRFVAEAPLAV